MRRREFITLLGGAAAWPLAAHAQSAAKSYRVGYLSFAGGEDTTWVRPLLERLHIVDQSQGNEGTRARYSVNAALADEVIE